MFKSYGENFTYQIEKVFNDQFRLVAKRHEERGTSEKKGRFEEK